MGDGFGSWINKALGKEKESKGPARPRGRPRHLTGQQPAPAPKGGGNPPPSDDDEDAPPVTAGAKPTDQPAQRKPAARPAGPVKAAAGAATADLSGQGQVILPRNVALLTAPGQPLQRPEEERSIFALYEDGTFLVSKNHANDPHVLSVESLARRLGVHIRTKRLVELADVARAYQMWDQSSRDKGREIETTRMEKEVFRLVGVAARQGASDIHIIIGPDTADVRFRVDGAIRPIEQWGAEFGQEFSAAAWAMSDTSDNTYRRYDYQAARISDATQPLPEGVQAIRIQFNPLAYGGRYVVMRLLYRAAAADSADVGKLGYAPEQLMLFRRMRGKPFGINIIAGPTGSGKSTTLQRNLRAILTERGGEVNVLTVEDPPEYVIDGAQQMPVTDATKTEDREQKFHGAIIAALRSDPDIVMIGEVRDLESARLAFAAAMTGHQLWTSLHATDAIAIIDRLKDIGVEDYKICDADIVTGLAGQRLMRTICPQCSIPAAEARAAGKISPSLYKRVELVADLEKDNVRVRGPGCAKCNGGITGRTVSAEVMLPDHRMMKLLRQGDKADAKRYWIEELGGMTMLQHGIKKMLAGIVEPSEVERVVDLLVADLLAKGTPLSDDVLVDPETEAEKARAKAAASAPQAGASEETSPAAAE